MYKKLDKAAATDPALRELTSGNKFITVYCDEFSQMKPIVTALRTYLELTEIK